MPVWRGYGSGARGGRNLRDVTDKDRVRADKREADRAIALGRRERWVVTTAELRGVGLSRDAIAHRVATGLLVRQFRGVYLVGRANPTRSELEHAAVKACGTGAVLSHRSAGARWRLVPQQRGPVEVTAPRHRRSRGRLRAYHATLHPRDITVKDGIPITTVARTLVDLATVLDEEALGHAVHEAEYGKRLHVPAVDAAIARAGVKREGLPALRRRLARHRPVKAGSTLGWRSVSTASCVRMTSRPPNTAACSNSTTAS